ncbi:MAG: hypothetical protein OEV21_04785 [Thermoplasmata archaeon]|nr:hypothetical protein [Thermoplasmata archaeon]
MRILARRKKVIKSDNRITIKLDPPLWKAISKEIDSHPEWGIKSVSEFVRRAIDHELILRRNATGRRIIELSLDQRFSQADNPDKGP